MMMFIGSGGGDGVCRVRKLEKGIRIRVKLSVLSLFSSLSLLCRLYNRSLYRISLTFMLHCCDRLAKEGRTRGMSGGGRVGAPPRRPNREGVRFRGLPGRRLSFVDFDLGTVTCCGLGDDANLGCPVRVLGCFLDPTEPAISSHPWRRTCSW